jgi:integrase
LIVVAVLTGIRQGAMLKLNVGDVDLQRLRVRLRGSTAKGKVTHYIAINGKVLETIFTRAVGTDRKSDAPLFLNSKGQRLTKTTLKKAWECAVLRAHGYEPKRVRNRKDTKRLGALTSDSREALQDINLHWHDLRGEFASRLVEKGVPLTEVSKLLHHRNVGTTERYIRHTLDRLHSAKNALELPAAVIDPALLPGGTGA